ncbi:VIT1/CCC1 transporter family protein [Lacticaseibacillus brantae]|uniref:Integral membrane protein n=1 Tax=Lacticaseibacillus brantae DSM 23927 TaxID=1423727 RepID=A0A0R2AXS5_9LACO|nr:VIT1/CCC1 transporter family protein [Lacticaseibacillus brantae]KRM71679.1 hypothetical protein FC34_GL001336 [Lacticaseibacillus brantae DSM 23927]
MKNLTQSLSQSLEQKVNLRQGLNRVRAGVMGANDGIISTAGAVIGVSGAQKPLATVLIAGVFMVLSGALSMAGGEYVSVSSQRDMQQADINRIQQQLIDQPEQVRILTEAALVRMGETPAHATTLADGLIASQAVEKIQHLVYGSSSLASLDPIQAAIFDGVAFVLGAILPLMCIAFLPAAIKVIGTMIVVLLCLAATGVVSAKFGKANLWRSMWRNLAVGVLTMIITYGVGSLFQ